MVGVGRMGGLTGRWGGFNGGFAACWVFGMGGGVFCMDGLMRRKRDGVVFRSLNLSYNR